MPINNIELTQILKKHLGAISIRSVKYLSGGWSANTLRIETDRGSFFIKYNDMVSFVVEARGLELLRSTNTVNIPEVLGVGKFEDHNYLVLEFVNTGHRMKNYWESLASRLASLHKHTQPKFGLDYNNRIGKLPQANTLNDNWIDFFIESRIQPQLDLAKESLSSQTLNNFADLFKKLPDLIPIEQPSLMHGDLWSGNVLTDYTGEAVLIDPAVYYGHREMEIAFTQLFGGFDEEFYNTYNSCYPLERGFDSRVEIYNLYPLLVHVNMFGGGYVHQVEMIIKRFV